MMHDDAQGVGYSSLGLIKHPGPWVARETQRFLSHLARLIRLIALTDARVSVVRILHRV